MKSEGAAEEKLPMFPEPGGAWRATLTNVTADARYFVRARGARSPRFSVSVLTVPKLQNVRFRITPPAYTHRPPVQGPLPPSGLTALPGTTVQVWAKSNRPLSGGDLTGRRRRRITHPRLRPRQASLPAFALAPHRASTR